jgi:hypothetical protein
VTLIEISLESFRIEFDVDLRVACADSRVESRSKPTRQETTRKVTGEDCIASRSMP